MKFICIKNAHRFLLIVSRNKSRITLSPYSWIFPEVKQMKNLSSRIQPSLRLLASAFLITLASLSICAAPGDLDSSFGSNGFVFNSLDTAATGTGLPAGVAVAIQPDGKILVAGARFVPGSFVGIKGVLARFLPNGSLDTSFGTNGRVLEEAGVRVNFSSVMVQPDGKIVVGATSTVPMKPQSTPSFMIIRYNADGTRDNSFSGDGYEILSNQFDILKSIVVQPDGKIVAGGSTQINVNSGSSFLLVRYNADGTLDSSFDEDGKAQTSFNQAGSTANEIILQPDGKIIAGGSTLSSGTMALARYNPNGSLDTSFGTGGRVIITPNASARFSLNSIALQTDGKIVGAGESGSANFAGFAVVRLNQDGTLDSSFGTNGIALTDITAFDDTAFKVLIQRNGKIIAVGQSRSQPNNKIVLVRYNPNGTLDTNFGQGGKVITDNQRSNTEVRSALLQPDGKIVVVGSSRDSNNTTAITLTRYIGDAPTVPPFDFDGDGRTDISVFRDGTWHLQRSQLGFAAIGWGVASDKIAPADFDGDGKSDLTVYRPSNGEWSVLRSFDITISITLFGAPEDLPRPADYDGDGKADIAVFRPSNGVWYRLNSSNGQFAATAFGQAGDAPLVADFDGDGKSDIAVYRPSNGVWYWLRSSDNQFAAVQFGASEDKPVAADYDGDGKNDISVFRPSNGVWYRLNSQNNSFFAVQFGQAGDVPTLGDFDGDGRADVAVFRPSSGVWYRLNSANGSFYFELFGVSSDRPIPSAFVP